MKFTFEVLNEEISVEVIPRKRKSMEFQIEEDGNIRVLAPYFISKDTIIQGLFKKKDWIIKKRKLLKSREDNLGNITDNRISVMGIEYPVDLIYSKENKLVFSDEKLELYTETKNQSLIEGIVNKWLRKLAYEIVKERLDVYSSKMDLSYNKLHIKDQKTRWGSCSSLGNININYRIIKFPMEIIDYLVVHELAHLKYMNHSREFWNHVENWIPDYKNRRKVLKETGKIR